MSDWSLRLRAILDSYDTIAIAALVVLALLGGWLTYGAYVSPGTHVEERTVSSWQTTGQFDHGATVTEENPVFPVGSRLSNRTTYFRSIAPVLNGTFRAGYTDSESGDLTARTNVTLVLRSTGGESESRTEYWRSTRQLGGTNVSSLSPGESVSVPFSVDVRTVENRTARIRQQLGSQPGTVSASVRATVRYTGTVNGQRIDRIVEYSLRLGIDGGTYQVRNPESPEQLHKETRTVTVPNDSGLLGSVGGPLVLITSLVGVVIISRRRETLELQAEERAWLDFRADRSDFDEWIVTMRLPDEALDLPRAEAETLGGLVDFAIDTDNAVVEHPDDGEFSVVHAGYRYVYEAPSLPTRYNEELLFQSVGSGEPTDERSDDQREGEEPPPAE